MIRSLSPTLLQGNLNKPNYFEGWFQKIFDPTTGKSLVIIYGFATEDDANRTGFIQLYMPGKELVELHFPKDKITLSSQRHSVQFGKNQLSDECIRIQTTSIFIELKLQSNVMRKSIKNSMRNYYLIPGIPCYHAVLASSSSVEGQIIWEEELTHFRNSIGYLEKNWGNSFPENYLWIHATDTTNPSHQVLFAQAEITWLKKTFIKHFGYILYNGKHIDLRRVSQKHIQLLNSPDNKKQISFQHLGIDLIWQDNPNEGVLLSSPKNGRMKEQIRHHSNVQFELRHKGNILKNNTLLIGNLENSRY